MAAASKPITLDQLLEWRDLSAQRESLLDDLDDAKRCGWVQAAENLREDIRALDERIRTFAA